MVWGGVGGGAYAFVLEGYILWDEGTRLITIKGNLSVYYFGNAVALSCDRAFIGARVRYDKGVNSGLEYIVYRLNGVWQEESNIVPVNGESGIWFGHDVNISGDTTIIRYPWDDDMGYISGSIYVLLR